MKNALERGCRVCSAAFPFSRLVVHTFFACALILYIKGLDIWLWYPAADVVLVWLFGVMPFDRAVTRGRWIKRHFVCFSSRALSAQDFTERARKRERRRGGDRNRQKKNRPDDGGADRQVVEQPAVLDLACKYLGYCSSTCHFLPSCWRASSISSYRSILDTELHSSQSHLSSRHTDWLTQGVSASV